MSIFALTSEIPVLSPQLQLQESETVTSGDLIPGDTSTTYNITDEVTAYGFVNDAFDQDWYAFTATAGMYYVINLNGETLQDPYLFLFDENGSVLDQHDDIARSYGYQNRDSEIRFSFNVETNLFIGAAADSTYTGSYELTVSPSMSGTSSDDSLTGDDDANWIEGFEGNDTVLGKDGDDTIFGGEGRDDLRGNNGNDLIHGGYNADTIAAGEGHDRVYGDRGADYVTMGSGDDRFYDHHATGANGSDTVYGDNGLDSLYGIAGRNEFHGGDKADYLSGGRDEDRLFGDAGDDVLLGHEGADRMFGGDGDDELSGDEGADLLFGDDGADTIMGGIQNDTIRGGQGNDFIRGADGDDVIYGGGGRDEVRLGNGNDVFVDGGQSGKNGGDKVFGGSGEDTIYAGGGDDRIVGGADADLFVFGARGWDVDTIIDFEDGLDMIQMGRPAPGGEFADLTIEDQGGATAIFWTDTPEDVILLQGIAVAQITADDFNFV